MITITGQTTFDDHLRAQHYHSCKRDLAIIVSLTVIAVFAALVSPILSSQSS